MSFDQNGVRHDLPNQPITGPGQSVAAISRDLPNQPMTGSSQFVESVDLPYINQSRDLVNLLQLR